jgi:hypothetical protein
MKHVFCALALLVLFVPTSASALGKCVAADGKVTYTERGCPDGSHGARLRSDPAPKAMPAVPEDVHCAAQWLRHEEEWQRYVGLAPNGDTAMPRSVFDFSRCARYGYAKATDISRFSASRWSAMSTACKLVKGPTAATLRPAGLDVTRLRNDCPRFELFQTRSELESALRAERDSLDLKR